MTQQGNKMVKRNTKQSRKPSNGLVRYNNAFSNARGELNPSAVSMRMVKSFVVPIYAQEGSVNAIRIDAVALNDTPFGEVFRRYERYLVNHCEFAWNPSVSKTARGMVHAYTETDVVDLIPSSANAPMEFAQMWGYRAFPILQIAKIPFPNIRLPGGEMMRGNLFTSPTVQERLSVYGEMRFAIQGLDATEFPDGTYLGSFTVSLDVTLSQPQYPHTFEALRSGTDVVELRCGNYSCLSKTADIWANQNGDDGFPSISLTTEAGQNITMGDYSLHQGRLGPHSVAGSPKLIAEEGKDVQPGQMVYWTKADMQQDTGDLVQKNNSNHKVGKIFLSRALNAASQLAWSVATGQLNKYIKIVEHIILRD